MSDIDVRALPAQRTDAVPAALARTASHSRRHIHGHARLFHCQCGDPVDPARPACRYRGHRVAGRRLWSRLRGAADHWRPAGRPAWAPPHILPSDLRSSRSPRRRAALRRAAGWLLAARIAQGVGAALLAPQVLAILGTIYVGADRARAFAAYGVVLGTCVGMRPGDRRIADPARSFHPGLARLLPGQSADRHGGAAAGPDRSAGNARGVRQPARHGRRWPGDARHRQPAAAIDRGPCTRLAHLDLALLRRGNSPVRDIRRASAQACRTRPRAAGRSGRCSRTVASALACLPH